MRGAAFFWLLVVFIQYGSASLLAESDTVSTNSSEELDDRFSFWQIGIDYSSNSSILGRVNSYVQQPSLSLYTSYFGKRGLDVNLMGSRVWNSDTTGTQATREYELSLGYSFDPFKWMSVNASYSHFFLDKNSISIKSMYTDMVQASVYNELKWWMLDFGAGYTLGDREELFLYAQTGIDIGFENVLIKNSSLIIQPSFGVYASNMEYYDIIAYENFWYLYDYAERNPEETVGVFSSKIENSSSFFANRLKIFWERNPEDYRNFLQLDDKLVMWEMYQPKNQFALTNMNFSVPVYYYVSDFMLYASISVSKPLNTPSYMEVPGWDTYLSFGMSYTIGWW